ncbi:SpoIID/LytB domain-containing protein [Mesobacillus maritimus]|uniref:SpoIID/LytB domain-containing protein n=1 Tax=Mesobacillus maritimus TaxID=1643336 RepID=A0ABS7K4C7_9BACI|nr:SpoIID/LytB domain-containing protein [Mesobacillus maritimus]MBY0097123.1 SpoIID/LytB domain-containing protein [Mesobacillus maritimus]
MKSLKRGFLLGLVMMLILPVLSTLPVQASGEPVLRVSLRNYLGNVKEITLYPEVDYSTNLGDTKLLAKQSYKLIIKNGTIVVLNGTEELGKTTSLEVKPLEGNGPISINNRPYLGTFEFSIDKSGYLRPTNTIGLEDYLKGVVPAEMPASWNMEALKAQSVTARTYAMGYPNRVIDDTQGYQVYGGYAWHERSTEAVQATQGQVITYSGKSIGSAALFSSSNGGETESNVNAWGTAPLPYLGIKEDPYDSKTPWSFAVKKQQIDVTKLDLTNADKWWNTTKEAEQTAVINNMKLWLKANGFAGKDIKIAAVPSISLHAPGSGGRVTKGSITIEFLVKDQGKATLNRLEIKDSDASKVRSIVGTTLMKSYLVNKVDTAGDTIQATGAGFGHGIGLSQYGAKKAGESGKTYQDIIGFYFDKTSVKALYNVAPVKVDVKPAPAPVAPAPTPVEPEPTPADLAPVKVTPVVDSVQAPEKIKDTQAPKIGTVKTSFDSKTNKVKLNFTTNEASKVTVYVKDSKGTILSYLLRDAQKTVGAQTVTWDASKLNNGGYSFGVIAIDSSNNRGSALVPYTLNKPKTVAVSKPVAKDTKAPTIKTVKSSFDSKKNQVKLSFTTNEKAKVTVLVKDAKGKVVGTLLKDAQKAPGSQSMVWNVSKVNNGKYSFVVTAIDSSNNKGTATSAYTLNKPKPAPKKMTGKVKATTLNIRSTASTKGKIVGTVKKNQTVTVLQKTGSWYKIQYGKKTGYVSSQYLTNVK